MSDDRAEIEVFNAERNRAFENDDIDWARKVFPGADDTAIVMAFHKARFETPGVSEGKRRASQRWLVENGVKRFGGLPITLDDPLPE